MGFPWQQVHVSACCMWKGCTLESPLVRKVWSCATSFLLVWMGSIMSQSLLFPCDMQGKMPEASVQDPKPRIPLETQENGVGSKDMWQGCSRSDTEAQDPFLLSLGFQHRLGFEGHEMKRSSGYCPLRFCSKECGSWGSWYQRELLAWAWNNHPLWCLSSGHFTNLRAGSLHTVRRIIESYSRGI